MIVEKYLYYVAMVEIISDEHWYVERKTEYLNSKEEAVKALNDYKGYAGCVYAIMRTPEQGVRPTIIMQKIMPKEDT